MTTDITENTQTTNTAENTQTANTTENTQTANTTENTQTTNTTENTQTTNVGRTTQNETRDTVFIGKKPLMAYVTSTLIQLANVTTVKIKARGMSIGRAVDVAQIISRKTENTGYSIGNIVIGSETLESKDGRPRNVSTIEIPVMRN